MPIRTLYVCFHSRNRHETLWPTVLRSCAHAGLHAFCMRPHHPFSPRPRAHTLFLSQLTFPRSHVRNPLREIPPRAAPNTTLHCILYTSCSVLTCHESLASMDRVRPRPAVHHSRLGVKSPTVYPTELASRPSALTSQTRSRAFHSPHVRTGTRARIPAVNHVVPLSAHPRCSAT